MDEVDKGTTVYKEKLEIDLDHPPGNPIIEPPLQFGHVFNKEQKQRQDDQGTSERRTDSKYNSTRTNDSGRGSQHETNDSPTSVAHDGADDVEIMSTLAEITDDEAGDNLSTDSSSQNEHVGLVEDRVVTICTRDILDTGGDIVIDISADLETGNGIRKDIAREHGGLGQYFQHRKEPGEVLVVDPYTMPKGQTIYYIISRTRLHDPFSLSYYTQGLKEVRELAKGSGTSCLYTVKVPYIKDGCTGTDVRDALTEAFSDTGIHVRLCVQPD